jgi:DNA modification methylase
MNDFKMWLRSWCLFVNKPSDYGNFNDDNYNLPRIQENDIIIESDYRDEKSDDLFYSPDINATNYHKIRRATVEDKIKEIEKIIDNEKQYIIWCETNDESDRLSKLPNAKQVKGSDDLEYREKIIKEFLSGELKILVSKPSIFGFGMNFQNINNMIFCGLSYSYEMYYQAVRRIYRFGQKKEVNVYIVITNLENEILNTINQKRNINEEMKKNMIFSNSLKQEREFKMDYETKIYKTENYEIINGDCVEEIKKIADNSIDFSIFSPPFANLYIYSDSLRDMGNCNNDSEFFEQFKFLIKELYRVVKENRIIAVHCKNLVNYIGRDGKSGMRDFRGDIIRAFTEIGFSFHSEVTIWKDPVVEMQRTKAHGLLYKQLRADSSFSRQGMAEYLVMFRKWGEERNPVNWKTHENFPLSKWQQYASPVWMDIKQTRVLNSQIVLNESGDEKHICPLQLDVIEKAVEMWTNPEDVVFSPFAGIGSEGYMSLLLGRKFKGIELKSEYFEQMKMFLDKAAKEFENENTSMFDDID